MSTGISLTTSVPGRYEIGRLGPTEGGIVSLLLLLHPRQRGTYWGMRGRRRGQQQPCRIARRVSDPSANSASPSTKPSTIAVTLMLIRSRPRCCSCYCCCCCCSCYLHVSRDKSRQKNRTTPALSKYDLSTLARRVTLQLPGGANGCDRIGQEAHHLLRARLPLSSHAGSSSSAVFPDFSPGLFRPAAVSQCGEKAGPESPSSSEGCCLSCRGSGAYGRDKQVPAVHSCIPRTDRTERFSTLSYLLRLITSLSPPSQPLPSTLASIYYSGTVGAAQFPKPPDSVSLAFHTQFVVEHRLGGDPRLSTPEIAKALSKHQEAPGGFLQRPQVGTKETSVAPWPETGLAWAAQSSFRHPPERTCFLDGKYRAPFCSPLTLANPITRPRPPQPPLPTSA
ncbi:hypothetical protein GQ53DRAFT_62632 [Thozetella sp. PMI_491]|nr:hypothetical protein GQ53DRAFT_62632 [Thozetella sp. PMI_491]